MSGRDDSAVVDTVITGVVGRMGQLIAAAAHKDARHRLAGATVRASGFGDDEDVGPHIGVGHVGVTITSSLEHAFENIDKKNACVIDFTAKAALSAHVNACVDAGVAIVVGTTGLDDNDRALLAVAAKKIPVLAASNTSLGANLLFALSEIAARALPDADVEIMEIHHKMKRDAPSGTALSLGRAVAHGRAVAIDDVVTTHRDNGALRKDGEVGVVALRGGGVPGEHTAYFFLDKERVELTHRVQDRAIFAHGALTAARFLVGKTPGLYAMSDVLGLARPHPGSES